MLSETIVDRRGRDATLRGSGGSGARFGRRTMVVAEIVESSEICMGGGLRFDLFLCKSSVEDPPSLPAFFGLLLSCRWPLGPVAVAVLAELALERLGRSDASVFLSLFCISRLLRFRDKFSGATFVDDRLVPLLLRLRVVRSFPLITAAIGGGCNIHMMSSLFSTFVTTGGIMSLIAGFRAEW